MCFDSILGKLVFFFLERWKKIIKLDNIGILDVYIWLICNDIERRKYVVFRI